MNTESLTIILNGKKDIIPKVTTLEELLYIKKLNPDRVVVEKNYEIIEKNVLATTPVYENDTIEIISFVGGG